MILYLGLNLFVQADTLSSIFAGIIIAAAFPLAAIFAIFIKYPSRIEVDIGAFEAGIFFSTISFSLVGESVRKENLKSIQDK